MMQTHDGYIWLGTFGGLARFDGVKFTIFDTANTPELRSTRIITLYEDRLKRLWIGTETGEVYTLIDGSFVEFKSLPDYKRVTVWQFIEDDNGRFYIASDTGLERLEFDAKGAVIPESIKLLSSIKSFKLAKGPDNKIWTSFGKAYVENNDQMVKAETLGFDLPNNILTINFSDNGRMFVSTTTSLGWVDNKRFTPLSVNNNKVKLIGCAPTFRSNEVWCQESDKLNIINDSEVKIHDLSGVVSAGSRAIFFDNADNIWLATHSDGLIRLSRKKISSISELTTYDVWARYAIAEDSTGAVWIAGHNLLKVKGNEVEKIDLIPNFGVNDLLTTLAVDGNNVLWAGGAAGLYTIKNGKNVPFPGFSAGNIKALFFDRSNSLWIGTADGLWNLKDNIFTHYTTANGLEGNSVHFITQTKDDAIWVGTISGASRFKDGRFENFTSNNGLSGDLVREILEDEDGTIWIGTYGGGINRLKNGNIVAITTANGLNDNYISRILVDDEKKFWILGNHGIFAVNREELNAVADGRSDAVVGAVIGTSDGMKSSEASGGNQYAGIRTRDVRLWFPIKKDVVIIDPKDIECRAPRVHVETISSHTAGTEHSLYNLLSSRKDEIQLSGGASNVEIKFTGIEFTKPERLRFFYKLEGLDENWVDASARRTAFYNYLPSGNYVFKVRALSSNGIWSDETATIEIDVAKRFWETGIFYLMCLIAVLLSIYFIYKIRVSQLEAQHKQQEDFSRRLIRSHETERQRLAGELHDAIGQNLLIMRNWAQLGLKHDNLDNEAKNHFEQISEIASNTLSEARTIVGNLSPQNLERFGLSEAVRSIVNQIERSSAIKFETYIENVDDMLTTESQLAAYRSLQECLNNVVKHSGSNTAKVEVKRATLGVEISVEDHGRGFDTHNIFEDRVGIGGFGLRNIEQRIKLLGGSVSISSEVDKFTRVVIFVLRDRYTKK